MIQCYQLPSDLKLVENVVEEMAEAIVRAVDGFHLEYCLSMSLKDMEDSIDDQMKDPPLLNVPGIRKTFCDGPGQ